MSYTLIVLWILMWGAAGYLTVRAIQTRIALRRVQEAMAVRLIQQNQLQGFNESEVYAEWK